jgi:hypothetical protein
VCEDVDCIRLAQPDAVIQPSVCVPWYRTEAVSSGHTYRQLQCQPPFHFLMFVVRLSFVCESLMSLMMHVRDFITL